MNYRFQERNGFIDFYIDPSLLDSKLRDQIQPLTKNTFYNSYRTPNDITFTVTSENLSTVVDILQGSKEAYLNRKSKASLYIHRGLSD